MTTTKTEPDLHARRGLARYAAYAADAETWIDAAAPTLRKAEKLHAVYSSAPALLKALRGLLPFIRMAMEYDSDVFGAHHNDVTDAEIAGQSALLKAKGSLQ